MVVSLPHGRRGGSTLGCLVWLVLFGGALYFGLPLGQSYWAFQQLRDEMRRTVRFAQTTTDEQMLRQVLLEVERLELPTEANRIRILRDPARRRLTIETSWSLELKLPFGTQTVHFRPRAEGVY